MLLLMWLQLIEQPILHFQLRKCSGRNRLTDVEKASKENLLHFLKMLNLHKNVRMIEFLHFVIQSQVMYYFFNLTQQLGLLYPR